MRRTIAQTNPYLQDAEAAREAIVRSVATSSAIEGIRAPFRAPRVKHAKASAPPAATARSSRGREK